MIAGAAVDVCCPFITASSFAPLQAPLRDVGPVDGGWSRFDGAAQSSDGAGESVDESADDTELVGVDNCMFWTQAAVDVAEPGVGGGMTICVSVN